jgi:hypothetical protein
MKVMNTEALGVSDDEVAKVSFLVACGRVKGLHAFVV